jgi:outer membrane protein OmpA-like peptidoglycan-associated protein
MKKIFLLIFLCSIIAHAQLNSFAGKFASSLDGMATFSYTDFETSSTRFGGRLYSDYYIPFSSPSAFGFRLSVSKFQIAGEDPVKRPDRFETDIYSTGLGINYLHTSGNLVFKSLFIGMSYIWFEPKYESPSVPLYKKTSLQYDVELGLRLLLTSSFAVNASAGLHFLPHDNIDNLNVGNHYDAFASASIGISFLFGNEGDKDRDGIPASIDKCPDQPEDYDGFEDEDGCPDPDNDGDGIPDAKDKCPDLPEDKDGFEDSDGCPDNDNDRDGITDDKDECPDDPEDFDDYLDSDGCPDEDNDNDNIPDFRDRCPNAAEDYDGFQDDDGCPDEDNDGDGIPDVIDRCPDIPEDRDGVKDDDGCPDKDNDNDGIPDAFDKCPNEKETYNGYLDEDGCPDVAPEPEKKVEIKKPQTQVSEPKKLVIPDEFTLDGVLTFYDDDYDIKPQAHAELNRIADLIRRDSTSRWRIEGHTDNVRPENENLKLSQQRATEVLLYFVKRGLKYPRFEAVGLGSRYPVADNNKPSGKAKNRRVVIKRIQ